jgi:AcrR family transcriptional regulator
MTSRRDHLVDTATQLFSKNGFRATGIDTVLETSGVAKKTLYNHFRSKDELIIAALQKRSADFMGMARKGTARLAPHQDGDPRMARVLAFFDVVGRVVNSEDFSGCAFINASAEYPRRDDPVHVACTNHKKLLTQFIAELITELQLEDPQEVARQITLLLDGAIVTAHTTCDLTGMVLAKETVRRLLNSYETQTEN